ncbi:MAG: sulfur carrier protein ThiS [Dehalococcoidia bacterium]|nr:sulfur carrier protein ThiS [Dehalococcoidia bacterium]
MRWRLRGQNARQRRWRLCWDNNGKMITITINGKPKELAAPITLIAFLQDMKVNFRFLAVGHNDEVVPKAAYATVTLKDGDVLEIVRPIGGG